MVKERQVFSLQQVSDNKQQALRLAERGVTTSMEISTGIAALMVAVPAKVLEGSAITITPIEGVRLS